MAVLTNFTPAAFAALWGSGPPAPAPKAGGGGTGGGTGGGPGPSEVRGSEDPQVGGGDPTPDPVEFANVDADSDKE